MDAHDWDARYAANERVWSTTPNQFVASELNDLTPGNAVDLAAGEGRNAIWLASLGWQVTAIDFSEVAIQRGRESSAAVHWVVADVLTCDLPREVDLAVVSYLQLDQAQLRPVLRRAFDSLDPGGTFFVIAHDSSNLTEGVGGPQNPAHLYTADDVLSALGGCEYDVVRAERVARVTEAGTAYDALVRLVRR